MRGTRVVLLCGLLRLVVDDQCWIIERARVGKKGQQSGRWDAVAFYQTLEAAVRAMVEQGCKQVAEGDLASMVAAVERWVGEMLAMSERVLLAQEPEDGPGAKALADAWNEVAAEYGLPSIRSAWGAGVSGPLRTLAKDAGLSTAKAAMRLFAAQDIVRERKYGFLNFYPNRHKYLTRAEAGVTPEAEAPSRPPSGYLSWADYYSHLAQAWGCSAEEAERRHKTRRAV